MSPVVLENFDDDSIILELVKQTLTDGVCFLDKNSGNTLGHYFTNLGRIDLVKKFRYNAFLVKGRNIDGQTPLHNAAAQEQLEIADIWIESGANVNSRDRNGETPLFNAARSINEDVGVELVDKLLKKGAEYKLKNCKGETPIHVAVQENNVSIVSKFLSIAEAINIKDGQGDTPLHIAVRYNFYDMFQMLVQKGAALNCQNNKLETPLHIACELGIPEIVESLLDNGALLNQKTNLGRTPLHTAIAAREVWIVDILVKRKALLNVKDKTGNTPLHYAVGLQTTSEIQELIDKGANVDILNDENKSPYDYAVHDIKEYLEMHIMLLKISGLLVNIDYDLTSTNFQAFRDSYQEEFEELKGTEVVKGFKLGQVLMKRRFPCYISNKDIVEPLEKFVLSVHFEHKFPHYVHIFRNIYEKSRRRHELLSQAFISFFDGTRKKCFQHLPNLVKVNVLKYLRNADLKSFVKSANPKAEFEI